MIALVNKIDILKQFSLVNVNLNSLVYKNCSKHLHILPLSLCNHCHLDYIFINFLPISFILTALYKFLLNKIREKNELQTQSYIYTVIYIYLYVYFYQCSLLHYVDFIHIYWLLISSRRAPFIVTSSLFCLSVIVLIFYSFLKHSFAIYGICLWWAGLCKPTPKSRGSWEAAGWQIQFPRKKAFNRDLQREATSWVAARWWIVYPPSRKESL